MKKRKRRKGRNSEGDHGRTAEETTPKIGKRSGSIGMGTIQTKVAGDSYLNLEERERTFVSPAFHCHAVYELYILKEGRRKLYVGNRLYATAFGDVAMIPPNVPHRSFGQTAYSGICMEFSESYLYRQYQKEERIQMERCFEQPIISVPVWAVNWLWEEGIRIKNGEGEFRDYLRETFRILSFYRGLTDCNTKIAVDSDLSPIGSYIQKHYLEIRGLDDLAAHYQMTKSYLCRVFKRQTGISIITYINSLKIQHACRYLNETDLPVSDIAKKCGFSSAIYFNRVFKKVMEHTPEEIRKMERKSTK